MLFVLNWFLSAPLYISLAKAQEEVDLWNFIWKKINSKDFCFSFTKCDPQITQSLNFHNLDTHKSKNSNHWNWVLNIHSSNPRLFNRHDLQESAVVEFPFQ
jgi:hypothetical protein